MSAVDTGRTSNVHRVPEKCMFDDCQAATVVLEAIGLRYLFSDSARKTACETARRTCGVCRDSEIQKEPSQKRSRTSSN